MSKLFENVQSFPLLFESAILLLAIASLYSAVWRLYFSPLSKFPGPRLAAMTLWYEFYYDVLKDGGGKYIWEIQRMHNIYGRFSS